MNVVFANYTSSPAAAFPSFASSSANPLELNRYQEANPKVAVNKDSAVAQNDATSWTAFQTVMTILMTVAVAVIGGGFTWVRSDVADIKTDVREIRSSLISSEKQVVAIGTKLDTFVEDSRRRH